MYIPRKKKETLVVDRDVLYQYFKERGIDPIEIKPNPDKPWLKLYVYKTTKRLTKIFGQYIDYDCYSARKKRGEIPAQQGSRCNE